MQKGFNWLASELARKTADSKADDTLDLTVAQASHVLKTLRNVTRFAPEAVADVLDLAVDRPHAMPPLGVTMLCEWVSCQDGDTVNVRLKIGPQQVAVKLIGCHTLGIHTEEGRKAEHYLESLFEKDGELRVHFPLTDENDTQNLVEILRSFAFQPADGHVYIGTENVGEMMVRNGYATREKRDA